MNHHRIMNLINQSVWAILPSHLTGLVQTLNTAPAAGLEASIKGLESQETTSYMSVSPDGLAVIHIGAQIGRRLDWWEREVLGWVDTDIVARDLERAVASQGVDGILLHIDSPGGTVDGTMELADLVREAATQKPVVAYTDGLMASAAYWIGSAASQIVAYPTAQVGSIGVVTLHMEFSELEKKWGIKRTYIYNGKFKRLVNDAEPLSQEGRDYLQDMVDRMYDLFVSGVSRNRGLSEEQVLAQESRVYLAEQALEVGLVDEIGSFQAACNNLKRRIKAMDYQAWKADFPNHVATLKGEIVQVLVVGDLNPALVSALEGSGADSERKRIVAIREAAFPGQEALADKLVADGAPVEEAVRTLNQDQKKRMVDGLAAMKAADPGDLGANPAGDPVAEAADAAKDRTEAGNKLDAFAKEIQKKDPALSYSDAFARASAEHPKLTEMYLGKGKK